VEPKLTLRTTMTQALAATVVDESQGASVDPFSTDDLPDVGDLVGRHYRLVRLLGKGMFGKVYVAERIDVPAHQVALKLVPRAVYSGRDVERELVMLAAASHPNIVQLKDHGMTERYVWLTMPVYEGVTLAERLRRGILDLDEAHEVFVPIARALDALHKAGLRHQDIKPENIFLATFAGRLHPILLDLGVAAEIEGGFVAGTLLYASPEQLSALSKAPDSLNLTGKMDTYCLAATLLVALVGAANFPGEGATTRLEIVGAQETRATSPLAASALPDVIGEPRELIGLAFCRWMNRDPALRPPVGVMADELEVLLEPERHEERMFARRQVRAKVVRRAAIATTIVAGGVAALFAYSKRETLRLASELDRARAEGAASFDKLDTCVASHRLARREADNCREVKAREEAAFQSTLERIARTEVPSSEGPSSRQIQAVEASFMAKVRSCEDEAAGAARMRLDERERLATEGQRRENELATERNEQRRLAESRGAELDRCRGELEARSVERASSPGPRSTALGAAVGAAQGSDAGAAEPGGPSGAPPGSSPPEAPSGSPTLGNRGAGTE